MDSFFQVREKNKGGEGGGEKNGNSIPWVEKYRPARVEDVVAQDEAVHTLQRAATTLALPHLLFYGSPGTGKTSTILAIAHQFFPTAELFRERVLELNASDERGIDVVRHRIKEFAMCAAAASARVPGFKIVVLDEADAMTQDAQNALRRTMEVYSHSTRFCLVCNYVSRIIEPLASRCAKFRFRAVPAPCVVARLAHVAQCEGFAVPRPALERLAAVARGDLRKAITSLQALHAVFGADPAALTPHTVAELAGVVPDAAMDAFLAACRSGSFDALGAAAASLVAQGYAADQFFSQLFERVLDGEGDDDTARAAVIQAIAAADRALADGADEYLQIYATGARIMRVWTASSSSATIPVPMSV